jgi:hypothetical protein
MSQKNVEAVRERGRQGVGGQGRDLRAGTERRLLVARFRS